MVTWKDVEDAAPEFAARARRILAAHKHKTLATLRADGSPRLSGIECEFTDGQLTFGSMSGARKGMDLHRDPRFALHSASVDPEEGTRRRGSAMRRSRGGPSRPERSTARRTASCSGPTSPRWWSSG